MLPLWCDGGHVPRTISILVTHSAPQCWQPRPVGCRQTFTQHGDYFVVSARCWLHTSLLYKGPQLNFNNTVLRMTSAGSESPRCTPELARPLSSRQQRVSLEKARFWGCGASFLTTADLPRSRSGAYACLSCALVGAVSSGNASNKVDERDPPSSVAPAYAIALL